MPLVRSKSKPDQKSKTNQKSTRGMVFDVYENLTQGTGSDGVTSFSPGWMVAVFRLANQMSYDRQTGQSIQKMAGEGAELEGDNPLIITSSCVGLTTTSSKSNHIHSLTATLKASSDADYLTEILPGDWIMAWMFDDVERMPEVARRLKDKQPVNGIDDGLKFVGRVDSVFKNLDQRKDGTKVITFDVNATAFTELDSSIIYFVDLSEASIQSFTAWMTKIGLDLTELFFDNGNTSEVTDNVQIIITKLFEIMLGKGARKGPGGISPGQVEGLGAAVGAGLGAASTVAAKDTEIDHEAEKAAPFAYVVPERIGQALGRKSRKGSGILAYADMLEIIAGRQEFDGNSMVTQIEKQKGTLYETKRPVKGVFLPVPVSFVNKPLWQMAQQFLNPTINEMFSSLKISPNGDVIPTMVLRQIPFTTEDFDESSLLKVGYGVTRFLDLPRWKIDGRMVCSYKVGRSNATKMNLVHVGIHSNLYRAGYTMSRQMVENPPIVDGLDIQRTGVRPYMTTVAMDNPSKENNVPSEVMKLIADRLMTSHLTLNGQIRVVVGIKAPISVGDNLQFKDTVFHIEGVTHTCGIGPDGSKSFTTTLSLSNGLRDIKKMGGNDQTDRNIYQGIRKRSVQTGKADLQENDPGQTKEGSGYLAEKRKKS